MFSERAGYRVKGVNTQRCCGGTRLSTPTQAKMSIEERQLFLIFSTRSAAKNALMPSNKAEVMIQ